METIEFVEDVAIMKDCLGQLSILSESLQKNCTTLLKASDYLQWTINALGKVKDSLETKYEFITMHLRLLGGIQGRRVKIMSVSKWIQFIQSKAISTGFD